MEKLRKPTVAIPGESGRGLFARACGNNNIPHSWMVLQHAGAMAEENRQTRDSGTMRMNQSDARDRPVHLQPPDRPRAALRSDWPRLAEDLLTLLRRRFQQ